MFQSTRDHNQVRVSNNFRNERQLNAQFFTNLLCFIFYFRSNMFQRATIFREEYITLLHKTLKILKCAVHEQVKWPGRGFDYPPQSRAEIANMWELYFHVSSAPA
jgi:hypothetical protein